VRNIQNARVEIVHFLDLLEDLLEVEVSKVYPVDLILSDMIVFWFILRAHVSVLDLEDFLRILLPYLKQQLLSPLKFLC
jgi:hypothetical protein